MAKQRVKFTFPQEMIKEPVIWRLGRDFDLVTNIRRADVTEDRGWVVLELDGEMDEIERGVRWVVEQGVRVDPKELVVAFITGAGLKTQEAVAPRLQPALAVQPTIASFEEALSERTGALPATRK